MKISCKFRNRVVNVDSVECSRETQLLNFQNGMQGMGFEPVNPAGIGLVRA